VVSTAGAASSTTGAVSSITGVASSATGVASVSSTLGATSFFVVFLAVVFFWSYCFLGLSAFGCSLFGWFFSHFRWVFVFCIWENLNCRYRSRL